MKTSQNVVSGLSKARDGYTNIQNVIFPRPGTRSHLSADEIGVLAFLLSLKNFKKPWIVNVKFIQNTFDMGRDKVRDLINSLILKGFIKKELKRNAKGEMDGYTISYSNYPEYLHSSPETILPSPDLPAPADQTLQSKHKTKLIINNTNRGPSKADSQNSPQTDLDNVVYVLFKKSRECTTKKNIREWVVLYGFEHVESKIDYMLSLKKPPMNPGGFLRRCIEGNKPSQEGRSAIISHSSSTRMNAGPKSLSEVLNRLAAPEDNGVRGPIDPIQPFREAQASLGHAIPSIIPERLRRVIQNASQPIGLQNMA